MGDLERSMKKLDDVGVKVVGQPKTTTIEGHDYRIAFVVDPDGYAWSLWSAAR
jgi:lactoylglutathione lyase